MTTEPGLQLPPSPRLAPGTTGVLSLLGVNDLVADPRGSTESYRRAGPAGAAEVRG
jgi:hypothetical protein